jgi:hypothetical protein
MARATVTTGKGTKVVVEGSEDEVRSIIQKLGIGTGQRKPARAARTPAKTHRSATDAILELKENGFFNKPKGLADIKEALASQGLIYPVTSLSGVALALIRKRTLGRVKENRIWCYVTR